MAKLSLVIIVAVLITLQAGVEGKSIKKRGSMHGSIQVVQTNDVFGWLCQNNPWASGFDWCSVTTTVPPKGSTTVTSTTTTSTTTSTIASTTTEVTTTTTTEEEIVETTSTTQETTTTTEEEVEETTSTTTTSTTTSSTSSTSSQSTTTVSGPTALERAHWCKFQNGSYVTLGQTFMYTACLLCQCSQTHAIICNSLQCQPTYCPNGTTPVYGQNECCPHCDPTSTPPPSCKYGGISFPQGSIIKSTADDVQCWCQSGNIECRRVATTTTMSFATTTITTFLSQYTDYFGSNGTTIYIIIVIVCVLLIFGSLLCCGGALIYYYYYYYPNQQQAVQEAYDQYYASAGWQPMVEDGLVDGSFLAKQAEAEKGQYDQNIQNYPTGHSQQYVPPPYATYSGPYGSEPIKE